jgi:hypothetical protein
MSVHPILAGLAMALTRVEGHSRSILAATTHSLDQGTITEDASV